MEVDVAIVGAGTAGAGVAWQCAKRGMRVLCVDARPLEGAGARWVNGVAVRQFDLAGVPRPVAPELRGIGRAFHLLAGWGPTRLCFDASAIAEVDMRHLVARLQTLAREAGAELRGETRASAVTGSVLHLGSERVRAACIVDASGLAGARLAPTPRVRRRHICAAGQAVHALTDVAAARAFFEGHGVAEGETLCFTGIAGGYSIVNLRYEGDHLAILTGSIPGDGHPSGRALLDRFVAEHPWVGRRQFGGARAIPIRRPFDRLAYGRLVVLGDAACQVFSAHGSGIGIGLIAGRLLAEALADGSGPNGYARRFQTEYGGLLAAYDVLRRHSQTLTVHDLEALVDAGLVDAAGSRAAIDQRWPTLDLASLPARLAGLARAPAQAASFAPVLARMAAVAGLYRAYPSHPLGRHAWSAAVARVVGDPEPG